MNPMMVERNVKPMSFQASPVEKKIVEGPVALQMEEVWKLLGFNGPAVQVQDEQGRPIAIGLEDLFGQKAGDPIAPHHLAERTSRSDSSEQLEIFCGPVDFTPGFGVSSQDVVDLASSHPFRGVDRTKPVHQGGEVSARWFDNPGQVGPRSQCRIGHRAAPGWRAASIRSRAPATSR